MTSHSIPEVTVAQLAQRLKSSDRCVVLDVREAWEVDLARLDDLRVQVRPMSQLAREGLVALPADARSPQAEIYVLCHHGVRSAEVTSWLAAHGWKNVHSVSGGIDEYARKIDRSVGRY